MNDHVQLDPDELHRAAELGRKRYSEAVGARLRDAHGLTPDKDGLALHIEGAAGEYAVAKLLGVPWQPHVNTFLRMPNLSCGIDVQTRSRHDYDLIHRPRSRQNRIYVLVTGTAPDFWVRGWIPGWLCRRDEWWKAPGGRPLCWCVPASALAPIDSLVGSVAA